MKVIGYTVGTTLPKPNLAQTDPNKGDYVKNREALDDRYYTEAEIDIKLSDKADVDHDHSFIIETNKNLEQKFWRGTQAEYDALETKDDTTMYIVLDGEDAVIGGGVGSLEELGVFATAEELNYVDGATSNIQSQLDGKANLAHIHSVDDISDIEGVAFVDNDEYTDASVPLNADTLGGKDISYFAQKSDIKPKAGFIYPLATPNVPDGFLLCDGKDYSRTEYVELFAAIGTYYGEGDGSTTFNVPNLQTRVPVGAGNGYELGSVGGEAMHILTDDEMPSHSHITMTEVYGGVGGYGHTQPTQICDNNALQYGGAIRQQSQDAGGNQPHNNMQPYTVINYIISTGKESAVYIRDIINGAQVMPLEVQYGGTGATSVDDARKNLGVKDYKRNLLDNSDFTNPVNQRGGSAYTSFGYTVDRWAMWGTNDGSGHGLYVDTANKRLYWVCGTHSYVMFTQPIEKLRLTAGKKYTIACMCGIASGNADLRFRTPDGTDIANVPVKSNEVTCASFTMPELTGDDNPQVFIVGFSGTEIAIANIALYEGEYTAETLPPYVPKGYAHELLECQRYFRREYKPVTIGSLYGTDTNKGICTITVGNMRIFPTITIENVINQGWGVLTASDFAPTWTNGGVSSNYFNYEVSRSECVGMTAILFIQASADL